MGWRSLFNGKGGRGFTLIETLTAIMIAGILGVGVSMTIQQMFSVDAMSKTQLTAVKQVENAIHHLSRDVLMAQNIQPSTGTGFPLTLNRVNWDNSNYQVIYSVQDNQILRSESVNSASPTVAIIARNIDSSTTQTNCQYSGGIFTGKLTASISGFQPYSESRSFQIDLRAAQ